MPMNPKGKTFLLGPLQEMAKWVKLSPDPSQEYPWLGGLK